jgi:hypothetical protein
MSLMIRQDMKQIFALTYSCICIHNTVAVSEDHYTRLQKKWYLYAGNVGFTGPIGVLTVEVIGLKSAPTGAEAVVVAA